MTVFAALPSPSTSAPATSDATIGCSVDHAARVAGPNAATSSLPPPLAGAPRLPDPAPALNALGVRAAEYAADAAGPGTVAAYRSAWRGYVAWCDRHGRTPLAGDPGQLALYLTDRADAGRAIATLQVIRAAVRAAHRFAGVPLDLADPRLALVMEGITRRRGRRPGRQAAPAVPDVLRRLLEAFPSPATPARAAPALAARHRAMLLIGFGAALRRSEIVALAIGDVAAERRGLVVQVRRGKTDQQGRGRSIAIWANPGDPAFCPLAAFEVWMGFRSEAPDCVAVRPPVPSPAPADNRGHAEAPLFCGITLGGRLTGVAMADKIVNRVIKQACIQAGIDPKRFSGHSLRRGLLTDAGDRQLPLVDVMRQSRHASVATALSYIEAGDAWRNNITEGVFAGKEPEGG